MFLFCTFLKVSLYVYNPWSMIKGIIRSPVTKEDEIRNVQIVIDALASNVLHTSLAHISGRDVVEGNREALLNLLEIFSGLLEYILNKIESDVSTDNDGMCCVCKVGRGVVGEQGGINQWWTQKLSEQLLAVVHVHVCSMIIFILCSIGKLVVPRFREIRPSVCLLFIPCDEAFPLIPKFLTCVT